MAKVVFNGQPYECKDQSVLDCLTAHDISIPFSCRSGLCQTCMMKAVGGTVPAKSQEGLKPTLVEQNYFLACSCFPTEDLVVSLPGNFQRKYQTNVAAIERLTDDILGIRLSQPNEFSYRAGQFINLYKDEFTARSYSLASVPSLNEDLFLNIRKVPGGTVSNWIFDHLRVGDDITISEACGNCFYTAENKNQNILLIGTGSGLAPLYGIVRDAISSNHQGEIFLYHGSYNSAGLYLTDQLMKIERSYSNFKYIPCVSDELNTNPFISNGMVLDIALSRHSDLNGWKVYLCGNPAMVTTAKTETFLAGASSRDIFADPF